MLAISLLNITGLKKCIVLRIICILLAQAAESDKASSEAEFSYAHSDIHFPWQAPLTSDPNQLATCRLLLLLVYNDQANSA